MKTTIFGHDVNIYVCRKFSKIDIYDKRHYLHFRLRLWPKFELWLEQHKHWNGEYRKFKHKKFTN